MPDNYRITLDIYDGVNLIRRLDFQNVPQTIGDASQMFDWLYLAISAIQGTVNYQGNPE